MNETYLFSLFDIPKVIIELLHRKGIWDRIIYNLSISGHLCRWPKCNQHERFCNLYDFPKDLFKAQRDLNIQMTPLGKK